MNWVVYLGSYPKGRTKRRLYHRHRPSISSPGYSGTPERRHDWRGFTHWQGASSRRNQGKDDRSKSLHRRIVVYDKHVMAIEEP